MTAFTAGTRRPQQSQQNGQQRTQYGKDRLLTVLSYDLTKALMSAKDDAGNQYEMYVKPSEVLRIETYLNSEKGKATPTNMSYLKHKVDAKMSKEIAVGDKVIASQTKVISKDNGQGFKKTEVEALSKVPVPEKTREGIFTVTYTKKDGKEIVSRVNEWGDSGIKLDDKTSLEDLAKAMDEANSQSGKKMGDATVTVPSYGIEFRVLNKTDELYYDGQPIAEAVETSISFDWLRVEDENGNYDKTKAHNISGVEMLAYVDQFKEHIANNPAYKEAIAEVTYYQSYPASQNKEMTLTQGIPEKDVRADWKPLYRMAHAVSFADQENSDNGRMVGNNMAVLGIIQISADKPVKINGKYEEVPTNWASVLHAGNRKGHVQSFIKSSEGFKVKVHPSLDIKQAPRASDEKQADNNQTYTPRAQASASAAPAPAYVATPTPPSPVSVDDKEFDPFQDLAPSAPAESAPAPSSSRFGSRVK